MTNKREDAACEKNIYGNEFGAGVRNIFMKFDQAYLVVHSDREMAERRGLGFIEVRGLPRVHDQLGS